MKIIDLLNKIATGEEVPKKIKYQNVIYIYYERLNDMFNYKSDDKRHRFLEEDYYIENILNDEVEILEEEKKIPEKLPYYSMEKIQKAKNKDEWREERITLLEKRVNDLHIKTNELIDYLKSKGDE